MDVEGAVTSQDRKMLWVSGKEQCAPRRQGWSEPGVESCHQQEMPNSIDRGVGVAGRDPENIWGKCAARVRWRPTEGVGRVRCGRLGRPSNILDT